MKINIMLFLCLTLLMLTGCKASGSTQEVWGTLMKTTKRIETSAPSEASIFQETQQSEESVATSASEPDLSADLAVYNELFGDIWSWYNRALTCVYESPDQLSMIQLFCTGFDDESDSPTEEEWDELKDQPGFDINLDLNRLPETKMNEVLTVYFGITVDDIDGSGFENMVYLESTNCWYHMANDMNAVEDFRAVDLEELKDGSIVVYYTTNRDDLTYAVTLVPNGDGYLIRSNVLV